MTYLRRFSANAKECQKLTVHQMIYFLQCVSSKVLCKEGIWNMRGYWEVEFSGWVVIGATYEGAARKANSGPSGIGENEESWGLCWTGSCYEVWFNSINNVIKNVPFCPTVGVYIDQPAGIICFYTVSGDEGEKEVSLLFRFETPIVKKISE